jgi:hypothetical protein
VHGLRARRLLRLQPQPARAGPLPGRRASGDPPGDDRWFGFPDQLTVRQEPDGRSVPIDLWWQAGIASVRRLLAERPAAELTARLTAGARAANGFPVGDWAEQQRQAHTGGTLPPERVEALDGVPGWRW